MRPNSSIFFRAADKTPTKIPIYIEVVGEAKKITLAYWLWIPCSCGMVYIGQTGHTVTDHKERTVMLG